MDISNTINSLKRNINDFALQIASIKTLRNDKLNRLNEANKLHTNITYKLTELNLVKSLLEKCNVVSRTFIKSEIESLVTSSLQTVFENPNLSFEISFVTRRNQTEADFSISLDSNNSNSRCIRGDIFYVKGGGILDVVSISLRIILMELLHVSGPIIADEPGRMISDQYIDNFGKFLQSICRHFNRQLIIITHNQTLSQYADNQIKINMINKISTLVK